MKIKNSRSFFKKLLEKYNVKLKVGDFAFENILKKAENDIDIDGDNVYDKNTNNVLCDLDNIDYIKLRRLIN